MATQTVTPATPATQINPALVVKTGKTFYLKPSDIRVTTEYNPRRYGPPAKKIQSMYDSLLAESGQIQPVRLRPSTDAKDPRPLLSLGFTRHAAAAKMSEDGVGEGPEGVFLLECIWDENDSDEDAYIKAIRENNDRRDVSRIDRAHNINRLKDEFGMSQTDIAAMLGLSSGTVTQDLKLLKLIPKIQRMVHDDKMSADAAIEISGKTPDEQEEILRVLKSGGKSGSKSDTQEAAEAQDEAGGKEPVKVPAKTAKVFMKNIRANYSAEALGNEGWAEIDVPPIVAYMESVCSYLSGLPMKGRRKPCEFKDTMALFNKALGV